MTTQNQPRLGQIVKGEHVRGQDCRIIALLSDLRSRQILYALAPEMAEALQWISDFCAEHPEWSAQAFDISTAEGEWLENVRAILARLPQKGGEK